ncbi:hypothetical protein A4G20_10245 [Pasteurellaceae bacterium RH1A]|nr:hypothetical protein A4G20_10245 [Pasteurellaceae bacterium RH1A]
MVEFAVFCLLPPPLAGEGGGGGLSEAQDSNGPKHLNYLIAPYEPYGVTQTKPFHGLKPQRGLAK